MKYISNFMFIIKYAIIKSKKIIWYIAFDSFFYAIQPFVYIYIPALFIDELNGSKRFSMIIGLGLLLLAIESLFIFIPYLYSTKFAQTAYTVNLKHRLFFAEIFTKIPYFNIEKDDTRTQINFIEGQTNPLSIVNGILKDIIVSTFKMFIYIYAISSVSIGALFFLIVTLILSSGLSLAAKRISENYSEVDVKYRRLTSYFYKLLINIDCAEETRVNNAFDILINKFSLYTKYRIQNNVKCEKRVQSINSLQRLVDIIRTITIYAYGIYNLWNNGLSVAEFYVFTSAALLACGSIIDFINSCISFAWLSSYGDRFKQILKSSDEFNDNSKNNYEDILNPHICQIEFKNIFFKYPNSDVYALKDVNLTINAGEHIALVGDNGSGKTTLIKLLCRFYIPTKGEILYNGINIQKIKAEEYYKVIAVVFQDFKVFPMTISENIAMNLKQIDNSKMHIAIANSGLSKTINSLPYGIETEVGKEFDIEGIDFSGGEKQRIACARAYYKNTPLIILDEPLAAQDPVEEKRMYDQFHQIMNGKTALMISHRLSSTTLCDRIVVLQKGQIVEFGSHKDLLKSKNHYYDMYKSQSSYYTKGEK